MMASTDSDPLPQKASLALKQWQFYLLTGISAVALGLVFVTTTLSASIGSMREQIDERQQFINETLLLSRLNVQLAQVLANLSVATGDDELKQLLLDNGITFTVADESISGDNATLTPGTAAGSGTGGERGGSR